MGNFDITSKSTDLMEYTIRITSNRKRYPVKYIQLIKRIQNKSMDIYEFILDANRLNLRGPPRGGGVPGGGCTVFQPGRAAGPD